MARYEIKKSRFFEHFLSIGIFIFIAFLFWTSPMTSFSVADPDFFKGSLFNYKILDKIYLGDFLFFGAICGFSYLIYQYAIFKSEGKSHLDANKIKNTDDVYVFSVLRHRNEKGELAAYSDSKGNMIDYLIINGESVVHVRGKKKDFQFIRKSRAVVMKYLEKIGVSVDKKTFPAKGDLYVKIPPIKKKGEKGKKKGEKGKEVIKQNKLISYAE